MHSGGEVLRVYNCTLYSALYTVLYSTGRLLDAHESLAPTAVSSSHVFGFSSGQRLWALTKRRDDIVVADIEVDMVADMEVDKVVDIEVDIVTDINIDINTEIQFGERVGHGGWLIVPKFFQP